MRCMHMIGSLALPLLAVCSAAMAADTYRVSAEISQGGQPLATPMMVVNAGTPARMSVSGDDGYRFAVEVKPAQNGTVDVTAEVKTAKGDMSTTVNGKIATPMTVATGDIGLKLTVLPGGG